MGRLGEFLRRARRRAVAGIVAEQAVLGLGAALGGAILLLILGTQILDWYWPVLLGAGSLAAGLYRTLRRTPTEYRLAQQIDARLSLRDSLSSGYYFARFNGQGSAELRQWVAARADELAATIAPESAVPIRAPRSMYAAAALALVVASLLGIRYGVRGSLDLRPPLVAAMIGFFRPAKLAVDARKQPAKRAPHLPAQTGLSLDPEQATLVEPMASGENLLDPGDPIRADRKNLPAQYDDELAADLDEEAGGDRTLAGDGKQGDDREGANQDGRDNAKSEEKNAEQPGENSSLLDKMRDAFQNMLAKLKMEAKTADSKQSASKAGKQGGTQKKAGEKGETSQERAAGKGNQRPDQQGDQMAAGGENAQVSQASDRRPEQNPAEGEKSGIGKSDGNKDIRDAEQLAAMGKISELFGKRQANLTGEVLVEVSSSKPQGLKTPYSNRSAAHAEAGGEIHRDEIPLIYQQYVETYFEQVRKQAPAAEPAQP